MLLRTLIQYANQQNPHGEGYEIGVTLANGVTVQGSHWTPGDGMMRIDVLDLNTGDRYPTFIDTTAIVTAWLVVD